MMLLCLAISKATVGFKPLLCKRFGWIYGAGPLLSGFAILFMASLWFIAFRFSLLLGLACLFWSMNCCNLFWYDVRQRGHSTFLRNHCSMHEGWNICEPSGGSSCSLSFDSSRLSRCLQGSTRRTSASWNGERHMPHTWLSSSRLSTRAEPIYSLDALYFIVFNFSFINYLIS